MDYSADVKRIEKRRRIVFIITCVVAVALVLYNTGVHHLILGDALSGAPHHRAPFWQFLINFIVVYFFEFLAIVVTVTAPMQQSLTKECDPEKYLALGLKFAGKKNANQVYTTAYSFMGDFKKAIYHAELLTQNKRTAANGAFNKARCEFFLGEFDAMKKSIQQHDYLVATSKMNKKNKIAAEKIRTVLELMTALSEIDREKIETLRHEISVWGEGKAIECFIYYMKGLAAYKLEDREECLYRFMYVKENGPKTFFGRSAAEYLSKLN